MEDDDRSDLPGRSPVDVRTAVPASNQDEADFSTLLQIQKDINEQMDKLASIDVFTLADNENGLTLKEQVAAYKKAKEILEPLQNTINTAVDDVKLKQGTIE